MCADDTEFVGRSISSALAHCHQLEVVHRDVKLENIALSGPRVTHGVMLIDFGLAETVDDTDFARLVGTKAYQAPVIEDSFCRKKADMWSLGVVLFTLCHGYMPLEEASVIDPRFVKLQTGQRAGMDACTCFHASLPTGAPVPRLDERMLLLLDNLLQIAAANRWSANDCVSWFNSIDTPFKALPSASKSLTVPCTLDARRCQQPRRCL